MCVCKIAGVARAMRRVVSFQMSSPVTVLVVEKT